MGEYFLVKRFLQRFGLGIIHNEGERVRLEVADLVFFLPRRGFMQSDFFDIVVPYLAMRWSEELKNEIRLYIRTNLERMRTTLERLFEFEGPYFNEFCGLQPGDIVIDVGANVGLFTVTASRLVGEKGKVYAFEPIPEVVAFLKENIAINRCANAIAVPDALGEDERTIELNVNLQENFGSSSRYLQYGGERRQVRQVTLDSFAESQNLMRIDFIKADIEGAEGDLLRGAEVIIRRHKPRLSLRIYHRKDDPQVLERIVREYVPEYEIRTADSKTLWAKALS